MRTCMSHRLQHRGSALSWCWLCRLQGFVHLLVCTMFLHDLVSLSLLRRPLQPDASIMVGAAGASACSRSRHPVVDILPPPPPPPPPLLSFLERQGASGWNPQLQPPVCSLSKRCAPTKKSSSTIGCQHANVTIASQQSCTHSAGAEVPERKGYVCNLHDRSL